MSDIVTKFDTLYFCTETVTVCTSMLLFVTEYIPECMI